MPSIAKIQPFPLALLGGAALALSIGIVGLSGPALGQATDAATDRPGTAETMQSAEGSLDRAWENFQAFSAQQAEEAERAADDLLAAIDREIASLDRRIDEAEADAEAALMARRDELSRQREALADELADIGNRSESAWDRLTDGIAEGYDRVTDALAAAWQELT